MSNEYLDRLSIDAKEFAHAHPHVLVIVADPETDSLFAGYNDSYTLATIKGIDGKKTRVVKEMLWASKFQPELASFKGFKFLADLFLARLADAIGVGMKRVPEFFKWVSDVCWYLPKGNHKYGEALDSSAASPTMKTKRSKPNARRS